MSDLRHDPRASALAAWTQLRRDDPSIRAKPPPSDHALSRFESAMGFSPPRDWLEWLAVGNLADCWSGALWIRKFSGVTERGLDQWDVERLVTGRFRGWKDRGWIPIGDDGCGDYFLLGEFPGVPGRAVAFWDQSCDVDQPAYVIASDFWIFMDCVLSGMDRSDSEDADAPRWPFDRTLTLEIDPGMAEVPQALVAWSGR